MQRIIPIESPLFLRGEDLGTPADWPAIFGNDHPLALEVGCGIGDFIAKTAADQPGTNFVAIDFYNKGCLKTCARAERLGLTNLRVLREEARQFIVQRMPKGSLAAVYVNCPDPWPKKRHRKRRLFDPATVQRIEECLRPGGELHVATDAGEYWREIVAILAHAAGLASLFPPETRGGRTSSFGIKYLLEGRAIHEGVWRRAGVAPGEDQG